MRCVKSGWGIFRLGLGIIGQNPNAPPTLFVRWLQLYHQDETYPTVVLRKSIKVGRAISCKLYQFWLTFTSAGHEIHSIVNWPKNSLVSLLPYRVVYTCIQVIVLVMELVNFSTLKIFSSFNDKIENELLWLSTFLDKFNLSIDNYRQISSCIDLSTTFWSTRLRPSICIIDPWPLSIQRNLRQFQMEIRWYKIFFRTWKIFENLGQPRVKFFKNKKSARPTKPEMYFKTLKISEISLNWVRQIVDKTQLHVS